METMSTLRQFLVFFVALLFLPSCNEWLNVAPTTQLERSDMFSTEEGYKDALTGAYSLMTSTDLYGRDMTFGVMDVLAGYYTPDFSGSGPYYSFISYPYKADNPNKNDACIAIIDNMWSGLFNIIGNLNSLLATIDKNQAVFSEDHYNLIKGEAIGLRAFLHFDLLRMFGPSYEVNPGAESIPFVDDVRLDVSPMLTVEEAAGRIIKELEAALLLMENDPIKTGESTSGILASEVSTSDLPGYHNRKYRFNYYAVAATLARAYLWKGDKVNALKYAKELIDVQPSRFPWVEEENLLSISSASAANKDRTFTTEHVFALNIRAFETIIPMHFSTTRTVAPSGGFILRSDANDKNSIYENNMIDPRNQYLFAAVESDFILTKLHQDYTTSIWFKHQMPMIRISEMYYIAAESEPNTADGVAWLNTVREARKLAALDPAITPQALQVEIQKEYQKEFIGEGQLWFYYKRKNLSSLPYTSYFNDTELYVFDTPMDEITFGGR